MLVWEEEGGVQLQLVINKLWKNDMSSNILLFPWRLLHNKISTPDALFKRDIFYHICDKSYVPYLAFDEKCSHYLFFSRSFSFKV